MALLAPLCKFALHCQSNVVPRVRDTHGVDNAWIADRLEAFASLLDLADANPYTPRAYRRAAETIRSAAIPVAALVQSGRVRELRGIGPGIEARLQELVQTGEIAELAELERELSPELIGLGRYLGLTATRSLEIARALGVHTAGELREAAVAGRLRTVPGIGPKREAQLLDALAREGEPRPKRGLLLNHAWELVGGVAAALGGEAAGDVRRWRDSCEHLAVVCAAPDPAPVLARFAALPQIVAVVEQAERSAVGVTVEGVPIELVAAEPQRFGTALVRATGSPAYVAALEPLPDAPDEQAVYAALGLPWCPPELREEAFRGEPPPNLVSPADMRGDLHCHTTWSDGRASVEEMGRAARERGYDYVAICDHTPAVGAVRGLDAESPPTTTSAGRPRRSRRRTRRWRRFASCAVSNATSSPTGGSIFPTTCWRSSNGCRPASTAGSGWRGER